MIIVICADVKILLIIEMMEIDYIDYLSSAFQKIMSSGALKWIANNEHGNKLFSDIPICTYLMIMT